MRLNRSEILIRLISFLGRGPLLRFSDFEIRAKKNLELLIRQLVQNPAHGRILETRRAEKKLGGNSSYWLARAALCYSRGDLATALGHLKDHDSKLSYLALGQCHWELGQPAEATEVLREALLSFPKDKWITGQLAATLFALGLTAEANQTLAVNRSSFESDLIENAQLAAEIKEARASHLVARLNDIYDASYVYETWKAYRTDFKKYNRYQQANSYAAAVIVSELKAFLQENPQIKALYDFGVLCGQPNYELAQLFTSVDFVGIDRQDLVKQLNDEYYSSHNLRFESGDIMDLIVDESDKGANRALFHARTGVLCYPEMLKNLYQKAADNNIDYIALFEPIGLSRETLQYYDEIEIPESIAFRSVMFIHNYAKLLAESGFEVVYSKRILGSMFLYNDPGGCMSFLIAKRK
jgi:hypothetical protein